MSTRQYRVLERWSRVVTGKQSGTSHDYSSLFQSFLVTVNPEVKVKLSQLTFLAVGKRNVPGASIRLLLDGVTEERQYRSSMDKGAVRLWEVQERIIAYALVHPACPKESLADAVQHYSPQVFSFALMNRNLPDDAAVMAALMGLPVWEKMVTRVMPVHPFPDTYHRWAFRY